MINSLRHWIAGPFCRRGNDGRRADSDLGFCDEDILCNENILGLNIDFGDGCWNLEKRLVDSDVETLREGERMWQRKGMREGRDSRVKARCDLTAEELQTP